MNSNKNDNNYRKYKTEDPEIIDLEIENLSIENDQIEGKVDIFTNNNEDNLEDEIIDSEDEDDSEEDDSEEDDDSEDDSENEEDDDYFEYDYPEDEEESEDDDSQNEEESEDDDSQNEEDSKDDDSQNEEDSKDDDNSEDNNSDNDDNHEDSNEDNKNDSNDEKTENDKADDQNNHDDNKNESNEDTSKKDNDSKDNGKNNSKGEENNTPNNQNNNNSSNQPKESNNKNDSAIDNKRNQAKQKQSNNKSPKSPKNSGSGVKDKLQKGPKGNPKSSVNKGATKKTGEAAAKKTGEAAAKAGKAAAKAGKAAAQAGKAAAKGLMELFVSTLPWSAIVVAVVILLIFIIILLCMLTPGVGDNVNDDENLSHYSEVDQETLSKMKERFDKYPNADGTLAMAIVLYPYFDTLQDDGTVVSILSSVKTQEDEDEEELEDDTMIDEDDPDNDEDIEKSDEDLESDDPYLEPFRKRKMLNRLKKVLKNIEGKSDEEIADYLKNDYFKKDSGYGDYDGDAFNGYKELFKSVDKDERDELADAIIEDLKEKKDWFVDYVFLNKSCSTNYQSAGTIEVEEMLKGNILVDVKVSSCTTGKDVWNCESMYDTPITMEKYVKGVTYEEIGVSGSSDVEKVKAQMVAAKSYVIGRSKSMGWGTKQDDAGNYIITIRANTNDQDYCDIDLGCKSGKTEVSSGSAHRSSVDSDTRAKLDEAWEATKNIYIYNKKTSTTAGEFCNSRSGVCDFCKKGTCLAHKELENFHATDFMSILGDQYSSYAIVTIEGEYASAQVSSGTDCSNLSGSDIDDEKFIYYSQNDYPNTAFCGRSLASYPKNGCSHADSICTSGCGVTSTAMVVATLTQNGSITPETINSSVRVGTDCGNYGSNGSSLVPYMASANGLKTSSIDISASALKTALDEGALVVANVDGVFKGSKYGTGGGHYIVVRGYEGDYVYVADPWQNTSLKNHCKSKNSKNQCVKAYLKMDDLVSNVKNHGGSGFIKVTGDIKFNQLSTTGETGEKGVATGTLNYPVKGVNGCDGSDYPNYSTGRYHGGSDINSSVNNGVSVEGKEVVAADGGVVEIKKTLSTSYGNYVSINHGNGYSTLYAHMKAGSIVVKKGDKVAKGQKLGLVGSTGNSTGPHLHIELQKNGDHTNTKNPCTYIGTGKSYVE